MPVVNTNSDLATAQAAALQDPSSGIVNGDDMGGVLLIAHAKVTMPASGTSPLLNANDTLTIIPAEAVPIGAVLVPQLCSVYAVTDPGTALTLDIGTPTDPDKFADALAVNAAGLVNFAASGTPPVGIATPYRFTTQEAIVATCVTVNTLDETVLVFTIAYRVKG